MRALELDPVLYPDLTEGINQGVHPAQLDTKQLADILNFYPWGGRLIKRRGRTKVTTAAGSRVTGLFALSNGSGWTLIVGQPTGLSRRDGAGLVVIPISDSAAYTASNSPWRKRQYNGIGYAVRESTGTMKRFKSDVVMAAGIGQPITGPTLSQGAVGALTAGSYYGVATYYNTETLIESIPSTPSAVLALAAGRKIDWTGIPVAVSEQGAGQVNARRLYRTLLNQTGQYFFMGQINNNIDTTFTGDNVITDNMGRRVSFRNGLPPSNVLYLEIWKERMWLSDGVSVFFSEELLPECFYSLSQIDPSPDDGHVVRGLHAWGERLVIPKTNQMFYLTSQGSNRFDLTVLSDAHGCRAADSVKSGEGALFWFEGDNFYRALGNSVASISDTKVRTLIDNIDPSEKSQVIAALYPRLSQYRASIPQGAAGGGFKKELVYNYKADSWTVFDYPDSSAPSIYGQVADEDYQTLIYSGFGADGLIYDLVSNNSDDGAAIQGLIRPARLGLAARGKQFGLQGGLLLCPRTTGTVTVRAFLDGATAAQNSRAVSLDLADEWKPFNLNILDKLGTTLDFELVHSGTDEFSVSALVLNRAIFERLAQPV